MIIDTPNNCTARLSFLRTAGVTTIIRYLALGRSWKTIEEPEARAIAGMSGAMRLGLVFEVDGKPLGSNIGTRDGHAAFVGAKAIGAPAGAIIWYAVDYDPSPYEVVGTIVAFEAFKREVGPFYRVGAYCSGYCAKRLLDAEAVDKNCIWITQSMGFRGTREFLKTDNRWKLLQKMPSHIHGLDIDPDTAHLTNDKADEIGDFVPFQET